MPPALTLEDEQFRVLFDIWASASPTGLRLVIELIEELGERGGGYGLMTGCAAGDTGAALVVQVSEVATSLSV